MLSKLPFLGNVGLLSIAEAAAGFLAFCYTLLLARLMSVSDYGLLQSLLGLYYGLMVFAFPLNLGTVHCVGVHSESEKKAAVGEFVRLAAYCGLTVVVLILIFAANIVDVLHVEGSEVIFTVALLVFVSYVITIFYGSFQGYHRYGVLAASRVVQSILMLGTGVFLVSAGWGATGALLGYASGLGLLTLFFMLRRTGFTMQAGYPHVRSEWPAITKIILVFIVLLSVENVPVILARNRLAPEESGYFGALWNMRNIIWPFALAISIPFYAHSLRGDREEGLYKKALLMVGFLGGAFAVSGYAFPEQVIRLLYGERFVHAAQYMGLYGISLLLQMLMMVAMFHEVASKGVRKVYLLVPVAVFFAAVYFLGRSIDGLIIAQIAASAGYWVPLAVRRVLAKS